MMIEALKQKNGYTAIDIEICNAFKTKYGLKIYEMYLRYYRLPNREGNEVGAIKKILIVSIKFIFSWHQKEKYPKLRIPYSRIDELIEWYLEHNKELRINSPLKYKNGLKKKIIEDEFNDLDKFYGGMLQWKYNLNPSDYFDKVSGKYRDF